MAGNIKGMAAKAKGGGSGSTSREIPAEALLISELIREEPFVSLFKIRENTLTAIKKDIEANGFDESKPVNVWKRKRKEGGSDHVLIDGFTRVRALEELGQLSVMAYVKEFPNMEAARAYAIHQQKDRRNLTDAEILTIIEAIDKPQTGFKTTIVTSDAIDEIPRKTAEITADEAKTSPRKVEKGRVILKHHKLAAQVKAGKKSINRAYTEIKGKSIAEPGRVHLEIDRPDAAVVLDVLRSASGARHRPHLESTIRQLEKALKGK
jgi:hypothetical protein